MIVSLVAEQNQAELEVILEETESKEALEKEQCNRETIYCMNNHELHGSIQRWYADPLHQSINQSIINASTACNGFGLIHAPRDSYPQSFFKKFNVSVTITKP